MSKIGVKPITVSEALQIEVKNHLVCVKGKAGEVSIPLPAAMTALKQNNMIMVKRTTEDKKTRSQHGLLRSLIANAVIGVEKPWEKRLKVVGTGYRVKLQGEDLSFAVGFSHPVIFKKVPGIMFAVEGSNKVIVRGVDKQLVGQTAEKIKRLKKPDPYKAKGIQEEGQILKLKPGKKAKTTGAATK